jgi:predicted RNA-binding Zn-ribbon protein involved in translation (DUF1610 family)
MRSFARHERFVECSGRVVLECGNCGEALILLGHEKDWRSEGTSFGCHCGQTLTLMNRRDRDAALTPEEDRTARGLLRSLETSDAP